MRGEAGLGLVLKGEVRLLAAAEEGGRERERESECVCVCVSGVGKCFLMYVCVSGTGKCFLVL